MKPITVDFWQFKASLSDLVDEALILKWQAEIFSQFSAGQSIPAVAKFVQQLEAK